jgi:hypothetical protein
MRSVKGKSKAGNHKPQTERLQRKNEPTIGDNSGVTPASEQVLDTEFPKTIAAARDIERSSWKLAWGLVEETGAPSEPGERTGSNEKVKKVQAALEAAGYPYALGYLLAMRRMGAQFPPEELSAFDEAMPISFFMIAGTPEKLRTAVEKAKKDGVKLTAPFIRATLKSDKDKDRDNDGDNDGGGDDEADIASILAEVNDRLEDTNKTHTRIANLKRPLSEPDRERLHQACLGVANHWTALTQSLEPKPKEEKKKTTQQPRKKAA